MNVTSIQIEEDLEPLELSESEENALRASCVENGLILEASLESLNTLTQLGMAAEGWRKDNQTGEIPEDAVGVVNTALESIRVRLGLPKDSRIVKALESFPEKPNKALALETSIADIVAAIWMRIVEIVKRIWQQLTMLFKAFTFKRARLKTHHADLLKRLGEEHKNFSSGVQHLDNEAVANFFSYGRKANPQTAIELTKHVVFAGTKIPDFMKGLTSLLQDVDLYEDHSAAGGLLEKLNDHVRGELLSKIGVVNKFSHENLTTYVYGPFPGPKVFQVAFAGNNIMAARMAAYEETVNEIDSFTNVSEIRLFMDLINPDHFNYTEALRAIAHIQSKTMEIYRTMSVRHSVASAATRAMNGSYANTNDYAKFSHSVLPVVRTLMAIAEYVPHIHIRTIDVGLRYVELSIKKSVAANDLIEHGHVNGRAALTAA